MAKNEKTRRAGELGGNQHDGHEVTDFNALRCGAGRVDYTRLERAVRIARAAERWRRENPQAWDYMERRAVELAAEGRRVGVQRLVEGVGEHDFADVRGVPTRVNNTHAAYFARMLVGEHPALVPLIERRASMADLLTWDGSRFVCSLDWANIVTDEDAEEGAHE